MRTLHWIGVVVLALVVGGAAGYIAAPRVSEGPSNSLASDGEGNRAVIGDEQESRNPLPAERSPAPEGDAPSPEREPRPVGTEPASLTEVLKTIPPLPRAEGSGRFEGYVRDTQGNPLKGVTVRALGRRASGNDYLLRVWDYEQRELWEGLAEDVRRLVQLRTYHFNDQYSAVTDAEGHYEITGLVREPMGLMASLPGYEFVQLGGHFYQTPDAAVDFVASRAYEVHIRVIHADGLEPPEGRLEIINLATYKKEYAPSQTSGTSWSWRLPSGQYAAQVTYETGTGSSEQQFFEVVPSDEPLEVTFTFEPDDALRVLVQFNSSANTRFEVVCVPDQTGQDPQALLDNSHAPERLAREVRENETAVFPGVGAGEYVVGVRRVVGGWYAVKRISYAGDGTEHFIEIVPPTPDRCITCTVTTPDARPLFYPTFVILRGETRTSLLVWSMGNHTYRLQLPPEDEFDRMAPGTLQAEDRNYGRAQVQLNTCTAQSVGITYKESGFLVVKWRGADLGNQRRPVVSLYSQDGVLVEEERYWHTNQLRDGMVLTTLQPGKFRMKMTLDGGLPFPIYEGELEIKPGFNEVTPDLSALSTLKLRINAQNLNRVELVTLIDGEETSHTVHVYKQTEVVLYGLPEGDYTIRYASRGSLELKELSFRIPLTEEVVID